MASLDDLDRLALALPATTKEVGQDGRPSYSVDGKTFAFHREPRKDAVDASGERLQDVLVFWVDGPEAKELVLADPRGIFFTTPHWNNYPAVLLRIRDLAQLDEEELGDALVEAWLRRAPKRVAKAWLAEHES